MSNKLISELPRNIYNPQSAVPTLARSAKLSAPRSLKEFQAEHERLEKYSVNSYEDYRKSIAQKIADNEPLPTPILGLEDFDKDRMRREEELFQQKCALFQRHWPVTKKVLIAFADHCESVAADIQKKMDAQMADYDLPAAPHPLAIVIATLARNYRARIESGDKNGYAVNSPAVCLKDICEI